MAAKLGVLGGRRLVKVLVSLVDHLSLEPHKTYPNTLGESIQHSLEKATGRGHGTNLSLDVGWDITAGEPSQPEELVRTQHGLVRATVIYGGEVEGPPTRGVSNFIASTTVCGIVTNAGEASDGGEVWEGGKGGVALGDETVRTCGAGDGVEAAGRNAETVVVDDLGGGG